MRAFLQQNRTAAGLTAGLWLASFGLERLVFTVSPFAHFLDYALCKLLLLPLLFGFFRLLVRGITEKESFERSLLLHALPILAALTIYLLVKHPFVLEDDERNIYCHAVELDSFAYWFNYPTGYYWIMGLMLIPHAMGPVLLKLILQALIGGYILARQKRLSGKLAWLLYGLFFLPFVLELGISAHRLPIYGMLYLLLIAKLIYDRIERRSLDRKTLLLLSLLIGLLTIWRTEGIYLAPAGLFLLVTAYRVKLTRAVWKQLLTYALVLLLVALPQLKGYFDSDASLGVRTKPFCSYTLCNMFRNGLTEDMIAEERADIEGFLPLSAIDDYNSRYGDGNYARAQVMNAALDADYATQERFCSAVTRIILKHPDIYLTSQWNAWRYTSSQYKADFSGGLWNGYAALSSRVSYPMVLVVCALLLALLLRKWLVFWIAGCGIAHWTIVTALMPAAFAKYYYVNYLMGYFLLLAGVIFMLSRWRNRNANTTS